MDEVENIKNWLEDPASNAIPKLREALWERRDKIIFMRGFIAGAIVAAFIGGLIAASMLSMMP